MKSRDYTNMLDHDGHLVQKGDIVIAIVEHKMDCFFDFKVGDRYICEAVGIEPSTRKSIAILRNLRTDYIASAYDIELNDFHLL